ncbi:MAG TPA: ASCH domain-containing protein [Candidatus Limnocylindria bacterium]
MTDPATFRDLQVIGFAMPGTDLRRELVDLVMAGTKTATAGLLDEMILDGETVPTPGMREAVIDADGRFVGEIETTECRILRMADVDDDFARDEGEGFTDARHWREAHERFWNSYADELRSRLERPDWSLSDDTLIVCQRFRLVERYPEPIPA